MLQPDMFQEEAAMPTKSPIAKIDTVDAFLESLQHPLKPAVLLLRQIFQQADPSINESIKWNVPSFSTSEYFATMHLRSQNRISARKNVTPAVSQSTIQNRFSSGSLRIGRKCSFMICKIWKANDPP
jgi:hypothetical protein